MKVPWASDRWYGEDKLHHFIWAYAGAVTFGLILGWWRAAFIVALVGIVVELAQWVRWDIWNNAVIAARNFGDEPPPRPPFADQPSYKDLAYDAGGLVVGLAFVWLYLWLVVRALR